MIFPTYRSLIFFGSSVIDPASSHFVTSSNIFSSCFPSIIPAVTRCSSFFLLVTCSKKEAWHLCNPFTSDHVVSAPLNNVPFDFLTLFSKTTFLLPPVYSVAILKLSKPHIYTSGQAQQSTLGLISLGSQNVFICVSTNFFFWILIVPCAILD